MYEFAQSAPDRGIKVIIAGAGGAAHLPGEPLFAFAFCVCCARAESRCRPSSTDGVGKGTCAMRRADGCLLACAGAEGVCVVSGEGCSSAARDSYLSVDNAVAVSMLFLRLPRPPS
eukprot:3198229-Rhodomonas_salina.5